MATNTSKVFIDIITQFTGTKSIKQADSAFKKLAKSVAGVVSVAAIERFSRQSVKAFLADDAAAKQLEKTLSNLGIYFDSGVLSNYIQELQDTTGVLDDELRPAFASLSVATSDYGKAQNLLNVALDVSQGTGKSLAAVSSALSRAYLGNFTALSRLGAGVSKADIATGNFDLILKKLTGTFEGSALAAAETYAGQLNKIKAAFSDAQETIGKGFVDAFVTLIGPDGSATQFAEALRDSALYIADIIRGLGVVAEKLKPIESFFKFFTGKNILLGIPVLGTYIDQLQKLGKDKMFLGASPEPAQIGYEKLAMDKKAAVLAKEEAIAKQKAATAAAKTAKAAADKLKTEKANKVLNAAAKVMDIDQAQILAALARDISQEDSDRLKLQQALLNGNAEAAGKLAQTVLAANEAALLAEKNNPFGSWDTGLQEVLKNVRKLQEELAKLGAPEAPLPNAAKMLADDAAAAFEDFFIDDYELQDAAIKKFLEESLGASAPSYVDDFMRKDSSTGKLDQNFANAVVNVLINPNDLTTVVTSGQQNTTASGVQIGTSRINKYS